MALVINNIVMFRCVKCNVGVPSKIRPQDYTPEKHKRRCDTCGSMMEALSARRREFIPEPEDTADAKEQATQGGEYLDLYTCLSDFV